MRVYTKTIKDRWRLAAAVRLNTNFIYYIGV
jgi:hypothetical protein